MATCVPQRVRVLLACFALCAAACEERPSSVAPFSFVTTNLARRRDVALNDELWLRFSSPLDPARVTSDSFGVFALDAQGRIQRDAEGREVRAQGELEVDVHRILFRPRPPLAADLSDGGFRPDTTYYVRVAGFPRVDGLCALDGRTLERTVTFSFRTASRTSPQLFTGALRPGPFQLEGWVSGGSWILQDPRTGSPFDTSRQDPWDGFPLGEPWVFVFSAPVRPDRIGPDAVQLSEHADPEATIPLRLRLLRARDFQQRFPHLVRERRSQTSLPQIEDGMVLEVRPFERLLQPYRLYTLSFSRDPQRGFCDGGGSALLAAGDGPYRLPVLVRDAAEGPTEAGESFHFQVLYLRSADVVRPPSDVLVAPVDGALVVEEVGGARVPWIRAAGRGELDALPPGPLPPVDPERANEDRPGWHLRRWTLAAEESLRLAPGAFHVVRSQGRLELQGALVAEPAAAHEARPLPPPDGTLAEVLGHLGAAGEEVCAFVAGGDLIVGGRIDLPGRTLVLASPTRVRLEAGSEVACDRLVVVTPRGGVVERPRQSLRADRWFAAFEPGEPSELRTALRYVALTRPVRVLPAGERAGRAVTVRAVGTRLNVAFQLQRLDVSGAIAGPFLDPPSWEGFLETSEAYRVLMHVIVEPGSSFDPQGAAVLALEVVGR